MKIKKTLWQKPVKTHIYMDVKLYSWVSYISVRKLSSEFDQEGEYKNFFL